MAGVWGPYNGCPGSIAMTEGYEKREIPESAEGTAAHQIARELLSVTGEAAKACIIGNVTSNGVILDEEIFEAALLYFKDVEAIRQSIISLFGYGVEVPLEMPNIHPANHGICDAYLFDKRGERGDLYIWEFKYGHGIIEVFENWQLIDYLAGLVHLFGIDGFADQHITVHARIVQPRAFHKDGPIREWTFKLSDIRGHFNTLIANAKIAMSDKPLIRSGDQCRYCLARHECAVARDTGMRIYEGTAAGLLPDKMSNEALGSFYTLILRAQNQIKYLETGIGEEIKSRLKAGQAIPGFTAEPAYGNEKWNLPTEEIITLGELNGINLKKEALITPTQAKKAGLDAALVEAYSGRPQSGFKVVADNNTKARLIFG
jgi:hypothetical protein